MIIKSQLSARCHACGFKRKTANFDVSPEKYQFIRIRLCSTCVYELVGAHILPAKSSTPVETASTSS